MKKYSVLAGLLLLAGSVISQDQPAKVSGTQLKLRSGQVVAVNSIGYVRIKLKDGTVKIKCTLKEFTTCCIIFVKDKVLHDVMTDKVKYIETEDGSIRIFFDDRNQPVVEG